MSHPKILFLSYAFYPKIGGIEVNSEILASRFHDAGYLVKLITCTSEKGDKEFPFQVIRNPDLKALFKWHKWADVVFENNPSIRLSWPGIFYSSKSIIAIRTRINRNDGSRGIQDRIKNLALKNADAVIAVSSAIRDAFFTKAIVIGNPYRSDLFKDLKLPRDPMSFVFLGRLVSQKGVHIAIDAFDAVNQKFQTDKIKLTLKIIGDGPESEQLRVKVIALGLQNQITFEGRKTGLELVQILNMSKYILVPSDWEAFGNVALEGMACGCLPFVSDSGGLPDAVGDAGVQFKSGSIDSLTKAILEVLESPEKENSYRAKMNDHLHNHYPDQVAKRYLDVIKKICTNSDEEVI